MPEDSTSGTDREQATSDYSDNQEQPTCPNPECKTPGKRPFSLAPDQHLCPNPDCPVVSFMADGRDWPDTDRYMNDKASEGS